MPTDHLRDMICVVADLSIFMRCTVKSVDRTGKAGSDAGKSQRAS